MTVCAADTCRPIRGRHVDSCPGPEHCPGCLMPEAAHPSRTCRRCEDDTRTGLRELPGLWVDLLEPTSNGATGISGPASERTVHGDPARWVRDAIRMMLVDWVLTLMKERGVTCPPDTIRGMCHVVAVQAGWLLSTDHADQLVHDVRWAHREAKRTAHPGRPDGVRVPCPGCGTRVRLDLSVDTIRCGCGEWGDLAWWQQHVAAPDLDGPQDASQLVGWLLLEHRLAVTEQALRQWATRGYITRQGRDLKGRMTYDPVQVALVAKRLTGQRKRGKMSA